MSHAKVLMQVLVTRYSLVTSTCLICVTLPQIVGSAYSTQPNRSHEHHVAPVLQNSAKPGGGQPGLGSTQVPRQPLRPDLHRRSFSKYGTEAAGLVTRSANVLKCLAFRPLTGLMPNISLQSTASHWSACRLLFCPLSAVHSWLSAHPSLGHKALYCCQWLILQLVGKCPNRLSTATLQLRRLE